MAERLTITVAAGGDDADARAFRAVLGDVLDLLDILTKEQAGLVAVKWRIIGMSKNSPPSITLESRQTDSVCRALFNGWNRLELGPFKPFPMSGMRKAQRLCARIINGGVERVQIASPGLTTLIPSKKVFENLEEAMREKQYVTPSSVDGKLDVVNVHSRYRFSVFDELHFKEVRCHFPDHLLDAVKGNLGKRVTVIGDVKFDANTDRPISIMVEEIEPLDECDLKPKLFSEMRPINISGDLPSEDYVRRLRNDA